jgi:sorbitol-specific phosphotransferase system component IIBC
LLSKNEIIAIIDNEETRLLDIVDPVEYKCVSAFVAGLRHCVDRSIDEVISFINLVKSVIEFVVDPVARKCVGAFIAGLECVLDI